VLLTDASDLIGISKLQAFSPRTDNSGGQSIHTLADILKHQQNEFRSEPPGRQETVWKEFQLILARCSLLDEHPHQCRAADCIYWLDFKTGVQICLPPAVNHSSCSPRSMLYTEDIQKRVCPVKGSNTDKSASVRSCKNVQSRNRELLTSLSYGMFKDCSSWCVYNAYQPNGNLYWWYNQVRGCWNMQSDYVCDNPTHNAYGGMMVALAKSEQFCKPYPWKELVINLRWERLAPHNISKVEQRTVNVDNHEQECAFNKINHRFEQCRSLGYGQVLIWRCSPNMNCGG